MPVSADGMGSMTHPDLHTPVSPNVASPQSALAALARTVALGPVATPAELIPVPTGPFQVPAKAANDVALSLILPTFNESKNIRSSVHTTAAVLRGIAGLSFELIVVDDDSPDETWRIALEEACSIPELRVMRRTGEAGLATAVIRGWQAARGGILAVMDADMQHPPEVLKQLVAAMKSGADMAVGSRHVENGGVSDWSLPRRMISRTAQGIGLLILPEVVGRVADPMSGYFMLRREAIAGRALNPTGYKILIEVLARGAAKNVAEVGYVFRERQEGESKVSARIYWQYLQHLVRLRIGW